VYTETSSTRTSETLNPPTEETFAKMELKAPENLSVKRHSASGSETTEHLEVFTTGARPKSIVVGDEQSLSSGSSSKPSSPVSVTQVPMVASTSKATHAQPDSHLKVDNYEGAIAVSHRSSVDSGTGSDPARAPGHFVVVAIDFGTTFSGYAFSFTRDPDSIHMMRKWEGGDPGVINQKTPTTLLLDPDGKFHSFGFSARDFYHDLDPQEAKKWLYFEKFKMALHYSKV